MALSTLERINIQRYFALAFNSVTGAIYLSAMERVFEGNGRNLADLARVIGTTEQFKSIYPQNQTAQQFADTLLSSVNMAGNSDAAAFLVARFNGGQPPAEIIFDVLSIISQASGGALGKANSIVTNKTIVSEYYTVAKGGSSTDLAVLAKFVKGVDASLESMAKAQAVIASDISISTAPITVANSVTSPTTKSNEQVVGTGGNDVIAGIVSDVPGVSTLNPGDNIIGGGGIDTLNIALFGTAEKVRAGFTNEWFVSGVEIVNLIYSEVSESYGSSLLNTSSYGSALKEFWQVDNFNSKTNFNEVTVKSGVTAGFRSTGNAATAVQGGMTVRAADANQEVKAALDGIGQNSFISFRNASEVSLSGSIVGSGGLSINADLPATKLNVALTSSGTITLYGGTLSIVDFSKSTGSLMVDFNRPQYFLSSLKGGSGSDNFTVYVNADQPVSVDMGQGDDTLNLVGNAVFNRTPGLSQATLGSGNDTVKLLKFGNIGAATAPAFAQSLMTITDFNVSQDILNLGGKGKLLSLTQMESLKGAASLFSATTSAAAIANGSSVIFNYDADAYILVDGANSGSLGYGDGLIKLTGVDAAQIGLSNGNIVL